MCEIKNDYYSLLGDLLLARINSNPNIPTW